MPDGHDTYLYSRLYVLVKCDIESIAKRLSHVVDYRSSQHDVMFIFSTILNKSFTRNRGIEYSTFRCYTSIVYCTMRSRFIIDLSSLVIIERVWRCFHSLTTWHQSISTREACRAIRFKLYSSRTLGTVVQAIVTSPLYIDIFPWENSILDKRK